MLGTKGMQMYKQDHLVFLYCYGLFNACSIIVVFCNATLFNWDHIIKKKMFDLITHVFLKMVYN